MTMAPKKMRNPIIPINNIPKIVIFTDTLNSSLPGFMATLNTLMQFDKVFFILIQRVYYTRTTTYK